MSPTHKDPDEDVSTLDADLRRDVRRLLNILIGDGSEENPGFIAHARNEIKALKGRTEFLEKIIFGGVAVVLLAVLVAVIAVVVKNPPQVSDLPNPPAHTQLTSGR